MIEMIRSTEWMIGGIKECGKIFCHKKVKILVLKKELGKNLYRYITNEKQNKMFAKDDLNSVALNMSIVRPQLNSYDYGLD